METYSMEFLREPMSIILDGAYESGKIWEAVRDKKLSAGIPFIGTKYASSPIKIMYVGHSFNGWGININGKEVEPSTITGQDDMLEKILKQDNGLKSIINRNGVPQNGYTSTGRKKRTYYHANSKFFRFIKYILEEEGLSDQSDVQNIKDTWYEDSQMWNERFIWSNLYPIAPHDGGNPEGKSLIKPFMEQYVQIFEEQIREFKPDVVIVCPLKGWFEPWKSKPKFSKVLESVEMNESEDDPIWIRGTLSNSLVLVCRKRPERMPDSCIRKMAKKVKDELENLHRQ